MNQTNKYKISVKGVVFEDDKVRLRLNERSEWELPGGTLEDNEQPEQTVVRELREELGFETKVKDIVDSYLYEIKVSDNDFRKVFVVVYLCEFVNRVGEFEYIGEAGEAKFHNFSTKEIESLSMPDFYKESINKSLIF